MFLIAVLALTSLFGVAVVATAIADSMFEIPVMVNNNSSRRRFDKFDVSHCSPCSDKFV